ncbi:unnamed protein product [Thelazia callipaeda]|uniref:Ras family protein n=1 Tax=Thelazia callipaeda TaxID=103827 RepID=A0A0N5CJH1_THECL|nr:unnamed protein product [Thelazia callipaeda]
MLRNSQYFISSNALSAESKYCMDQQSRHEHEKTKKASAKASKKLLYVAVGKTTLLKVLINAEKLRIPNKYEPTVSTGWLASFIAYFCACAYKFTENLKKVKIFDFEGYQCADKILEPFSFKIYDTSGKTRYDRLRQLTYLDVNVVVICFSIDSRKSFWNAEHRWYDEIRYGFCPKNVPFVLVATKCDLRGDSSTVEKLEKERINLISTEEGKKLAERINAYAYRECTSKNRVIHSKF